MPHSAGSLPPSKRHSRLTTVRRGCKMVTYRRDSWRSHVHRTRLRSVCSHSSYKLPMPGVEGPSPRLSLGDSKGVFSSEREYPLWCRGAHAAPPPSLALEKGCSAAALRLNPLRPMGAKKEQPFRAATFPRPRRESCPNCQYGILIPISPLFSLDNMLY